MSNNLKMLSFGARVGFAQLGAAITNAGGAATVSASIKPDGTTPADWLDLTTVEEGSIESKVTEEDVMAPSPGAYRRKDIFSSSLALDISITGQEINEQMLQSLLQSPALVNNTLTVIGGELNKVYGWLQLTAAAQNDADVLLLSVYGILTMKMIKIDGKRFKPALQFRVLYNALNKVTSTLASA